MKPENKNIDHIIARKLSNFEVVPPVDMWARIEKTRKRRRIVLIMKYAALFLLFISSGSLLWYMTKESVPVNTPVLSGLVTDVDEKTSVSTDEPEFFAANSAEPNSEPATNRGLNLHNKLNPSGQLTKPEEMSRIVTPGESFEEPKLSNLDSPADQEVIIADASNDNQESKAVLILPEPLDMEVSSAMDQKSDKSLWNLGLAYGLMPTTEFNAETGSKRIASSEFSFDNFQDDLAYETVFFDQIESTVFKPPVSVGIVFALRISPRFNFESGLQYTLLSHESRTIVSNARRSVYRTDLHYIGLPLGVQFSLIKKSFMRLYVSQSVLLEKGIQANYAADRYEKTKLLRTDYSKSDVRGIQLSSVSSLGIEMPVFRFISIYGQAGAQYFFLNKTQPFNLRSEQTLWPSFQTGLRITFDR
ncbi:MAG: hypothetical protein Q8S18_14960 [Bacteroidales bacterium]|nr:hypothetical protein [Bacteroidales bacterium]